MVNCNLFNFLGLQGYYGLAQDDTLFEGLLLFRLVPLTNDTYGFEDDVPVKVTRVLSMSR